MADTYSDHTRLDEPTPDTCNTAVLISSVEDGVVQITMQDVHASNGFSPDIVRGLVSAFERIAGDANVKAVILTGQGNYFSSGGTKEGLLSINQGVGSFTDIKLYEMALRCEVPVVAAMQGHAVGGGFVLGLFADLVVLGRECIYAANFMRYGFTPGMGGTLVLPHKLGDVLAQEMMLTGANYRGIDLQQRGAPFVILPKDQVLLHARMLARDLAEKPRQSLITLKRHLTRTLREALDEVIQQELEMHEMTFHGQDIRTIIERNFGA